VFYSLAPTFGMFFYAPPGISGPDLVQQFTTLPW